MEDEILNLMNSSRDPGQGRNHGRGGPSAKCHRLVKVLPSLEHLRTVALTRFRLHATRLAVDDPPTMDGSEPWMGTRWGLGFGMGAG
jgi:hypothetical protein